MHTGGSSAHHYSHGDPDHTGNAAYIRGKYKSKIAMHHHDAPMAKSGDTFYNRRKPNVLFRVVSRLMFNLKTDDRFTPDIYLNDGDDLNTYGLDAQIIFIPGHSTGSIGLLTSDGALFSGDFLENIRRPSVGSIMDDKHAASKSMEKLNSHTINKVYPGHGTPFDMKDMG